MEADEKDGLKTVSQYRDIAREKLMGTCSVNRIYDGDADRLCMGQKFGERIGFGGEGQGKTPLANYQALDNFILIYIIKITWIVPAIL